MDTSDSRIPLSVLPALQVAGGAHMHTRTPSRTSNESSATNQEDGMGAQSGANTSVKNLGRRNQVAPTALTTNQRGEVPDGSSTTYIDSTLECEDSERRVKLDVETLRAHELAEREKERVQKRSVSFGEVRSWENATPTHKAVALPPLPRAQSNGSNEGARGFDVTTSKDGYGVDQPAITYQVTRINSATSVTTINSGTSERTVWGDGLAQPIRANSFWLFPSLPLDPRSTFMTRWMLLTSTLLVYTALVTPYEVVFIVEPNSHDEVALADNVLWWINLLLDFCFLLDVVLNFVTAFYDQRRDVWVTSWHKIAKFYLSRWFLIDVISGIPVGLIKGRPGSGTPQSQSRLALVRLAKLLRFAKLLRVLRAGRIMQKFESVFELNYELLRLAKFLVGLLVYIHWEACLWRFAAGEDWQASNNWIHNLHQSLEGRTLSNDEIWVSAIHLSWTGNLVCENVEERWVMTFSVLMHTWLTAFLIGEVSNIIENLNEDASKFVRFIRQLNTFMREKNLDADLRVRLREFFRYRFNMEVVNASSARQDALLQDLSPMLRSELAYAINRGWIEHVSIFNDLEHDAIVEITLKMVTTTFAPREFVFKSEDLARDIFVVQRGVVAVRGRFCTKGSVFGERAFLSRGRQRRGYNGVTLTYTCLQIIEAEAMHTLLQRYPKSYKKVRRRIIKNLMYTVFVQYAGAMKRRIARRAAQDLKNRKPTPAYETARMARPATFFDYAVWLATTENREYLDKMALRIQQCWRCHILRHAGTLFHPKGYIYARILRTSGLGRRLRRKVTDGGGSGLMTDGGTITTKPSSSFLSVTSAEGSGAYDGIAPDVHGGVNVSGGSGALSWLADISKRLIRLQESVSRNERTMAQLMMMHHNPSGSVSSFSTPVGASASASAAGVD